MMWLCYLEPPPPIFALGPLSLDKREWQDCRAALDHGMAKFAWLAPVAAEMFGASTTQPG